MNIFHSALNTNVLLQEKNTKYYLLSAFVATLTLNLFFIFLLKSILPWAWEDPDGYAELAVSLLKSGTFTSSTFRIWGYPYFIAFFYGIFGENKLIILLVQAVLNAFIPVIIFKITAEEINRTIAYIASAMAVVFSYTIFYTLTLYPDFLCAFLTVFSMFLFVRAKNRNSMPYFIFFGIFSSFAFQVRPNMVFFPFFISLLYLLGYGFNKKRILQVITICMTFILCIAPWVYRNYRINKYFILTTTHGSLQLWFASLEHLENFYRHYDNKLAALAEPNISYSSLSRQRSVIKFSLTGLTPEELNKVGDVLMELKVNDRSAPTVSIRPARLDDGSYTFSIAPQPFGTRLYYIFKFWFKNVDYIVPGNGFKGAFVYLIDMRHLYDIDGGKNDFLNVFDVVKMTNALYGSDTLVALPLSYDFNRDSKVDAEDLSIAINALAFKETPEQLYRKKSFKSNAFYSYEGDMQYHRLNLNYAEKTKIIFPRKFNGKITSIDYSNTELAKNIMMNFILINGLTQGYPGSAAYPLSDFKNNSKFFGVTVTASPEFPEVHNRRRHQVLAMENIKNYFPQYLLASMARLIKLWVPVGSNDISIAIQKSKFSFKLGSILSIFMLFGTFSGIYFGIKHKMGILFILAPIIYISFTICWVFVQSRYSLAAQPFTLIFIAIAIERIINYIKKSLGIKKDLPFGN